MHTDEYFEYLVGDHGYMGKDMFIMHHIGWRELAFEVVLDIMRAYNKMHASSYNVFNFLF